MRALVILNPGAGQNAHESVHEALRTHFGAAKIQYEIHESLTGERIGRTVKARLADGFDLVVTVGGDGTVSDVADGLAGSLIPLGIIPTGTGNLFARELDIPIEVDAAVRLIAGAHRARDIDAMRIGKRVFILNISVGISASVISGTPPGIKNRFGRIAYIVTTALKMFTWKLQSVAVAVDDSAHEYRAIEVAVLNCGVLARIFNPRGPEIRIDDGRLNVFIVGLNTIRDYPRYILGLIAGRPFNLVSRFIEAKRRVTVRSRVPLPVQADGDIIGTTPVEVELLPGAITVLVPETEEE